MPRRESYEQGVPNWVDMQSPDQGASKTFYGDLFGWTYDDQPMSEGHVYSMAVKNDGLVAAIAPRPPEMQAQGVPPMWNTYLAVDDADAAAVRATDAGGALVMPPFDVMDAGRMCFAVDPAGAPIGLWQAKEHIGATVVNEPGAVIWNELLTPKTDEVVAFYGKVFGLASERIEMDGQPYTMLKVGDTAVAGTAAPPMEGIPPHWHVYFAVEDCADAVRRAGELGATTLSGPNDTPIGFMAALSDPQGAMFSVFSPKGDAS